MRTNDRKQRSIALIGLLESFSDDLFSLLQIVKGIFLNNIKNRLRFFFDCDY
jgi:hypothetical protein